MKAFEFRLGVVLRLRETQLELERGKLRQLIAEKENLTSTLEALGAERLRAKAFLCSQTDLETTELRNVSAFLLGTEARAGVLRSRIEESARLIDKQKQCAIQAERKVRLLEKLRGKQLSEWKRESDRELEISAHDSWLALQYAGGNLRRSTEE